MGKREVLTPSTIFRVRIHSGGLEMTLDGLAIKFDSNLYNLEGGENQINVIASLMREDDRPQFSTVKP